MARTYREAGVDREEAARAVERIAEAAASTATPAVLGGVGGFGGALPLRPVHVSGSGPRQQHRWRRHEAEGRAGARPPRHDRDRPRQRLRQRHRRHRRGPALLPRLPRPSASCAPTSSRRSSAGVAAGCAAAGIPLVGGETAQMPDLYRGDDYDLVGLRRRRRRARRPHRRLARCAPATSLLGLPSSGLHTNGYSLARRVLPETIWARADAGRPGHDRRGAARAASVLPRRGPHPAPGAARGRDRHRRPGPPHRRRLGGQPAAHAARTASGVEVETGSWPVPRDLQPHPAAWRHRRRRDGPHLQPRHRHDGGRAGRRASRRRWPRCRRRAASGGSSRFPRARRASGSHEARASSSPGAARTSRRSSTPGCRRRARRQQPARRPRARGRGRARRAERRPAPRRLRRRRPRATPPSAAALAEAGVELAVLAGYDQLLRPAYFAAFAGRTINIHPSLLPAHGGPGMMGLDGPSVGPARR